MAAILSLPHRLRPSRSTATLAGFDAALALYRCHFSLAAPSAHRTVHLSPALSTRQLCSPLHHPAAYSHLIARSGISTPLARSSFTTSSAASPSAAAALLPLVYQHDRSSYYRRLTLAAAASLAVVWLPLCYASIVVASPPLYATLLGPLAAVATLAATHFRAHRIIRSLRRAPAGLLVHTYTALGAPHLIGTVPYGSITPTSNAGGGGNKHYWIVSVAGHKRYFLIDRQGEVLDREAMRRVVGFEQVESEEERTKRQRDGVKGPGTLGRLQRR